MVCSLTQRSSDMAILKGPVRREEYDPNWTPPPPGTMPGEGGEKAKAVEDLVDALEAVMKANSAASRADEGEGSGEGEGDSDGKIETLISVDGDIEKVSVKEIYRICQGKLPAGFLVKQG